VVRESRIKENQTRDINRNLITTNHHHHLTQHQQSSPKLDLGDAKSDISTSTPHHRHHHLNSSPPPKTSKYDVTILRTTPNHHQSSETVQYLHIQNKPRTESHLTHRRSAENQTKLPKPPSAPDKQQKAKTTQTTENENRNENRNRT
jgi:hypothetical protein